ncbi:TerC family protein [Rhabdochlamydiaceae symbiont of Dictyostelium giganteum]|uniref:TerC family protein n=1 Tax=Rhabdochlamydiaceae symbiont of Dictyostelium giganteum TaxID=3342349 RepID=UPI0038514F43
MFWIIFHVIFVTLFFIDLTLKISSSFQALFRSFLWIILTLIWNGIIYWKMGSDLALEFFTAYAVEKLLSVDNLCVFAWIFSYFKLSLLQERWVLTWGILGASVFRLSLIGLGIKILSWFHPLLYLMGFGIMYMGIKFFGSSTSPFDYQKTLHFFKKHLPIAEVLNQNRLYVREEGKFKWTLLAVALFCIEGVDLIFALDSVPLVFGITHNLFIAYTSNICAILGLRSLYFALIPYLENIEKFQGTLGLILLLIGAKMVLSFIYEVPPLLFLMLIVSVIISMEIRKKFFSSYNS